MPLVWWVLELNFFKGQRFKLCYLMFFFMEEKFFSRNCDGER